MKRISLLLLALILVVAAVLRLGPFHVAQVDLIKVHQSWENGSWRRHRGAKVSVSQCLVQIAFGCGLLRSLVDGEQSPQHIGAVGEFCVKTHGDPP